MTDTDILPFELTADSVGDWLAVLENLSIGEKVKRLNKIANHFINDPVEPGLLFPVLDKLTETVLLVSKILEHMGVSENRVTLPENTRKFTSFAIQLPKKLSLAYVQLAGTDSIAEAQQAVCIYRALQIFLLLIKRNTLFYEAPDLTFWKKIAELYLLAETSRLLTAPITDSIPGLPHHSNIESVIKHALLFYVCRPYRYSPSDIVDIFAVTADIAQGLAFEPETSDKTMFYWSPSAQCPPQCVNPDRTQENALFFNTHELINYFERYFFNNPEKKSLIKDLLTHLTAYEELRQSVTPGNSQKAGLIVGTQQAFKFLNILISRYRILQLSGAIHEKNLPVKLELVPMEAGKQAMASLSTKILRDDKSLAVTNIGTYPTDEEAFCMTKTGLACTMDEPVILTYEDQPPLFALIRHIRTETGVKLKSLLLEVIDGAVYPIEIGESHGFIIAKSASDAAELFLPPAYSYMNNSVVFAEKSVLNKSIKIEKFIEATAHFSRYQVSIY